MNTGVVNMTSVPRQPYEEYRGPAGRLQPSPERSPERNSERSPERPQPSDRFEQRPPERPQPDRFEGDRPRDSRDDRYADNNGRYGERPPATPPVGYPDERMSDQRPDQRPTQQRPEQSRSNGNANGRPQNGDRALNVRPYSEAPKLDLNRPEGMPSEP